MHIGRIYTHTLCYTGLLPFHQTSIFIQILGGMLIGSLGSIWEGAKKQWTSDSVAFPFAFSCQPVSLLSTTTSFWLFFPFFLFFFLCICRFHVDFFFLLLSMFCGRQRRPQSKLILSAPTEPPHITRKEDIT